MRSPAERHVQIAARLYDARRAMRTMHGDSFAARVAEVRPYIEGRMQQAGESEIEAALHLAQGVEHPLARLLILATAVEMVEPEEVSHA